MWQGGKIAIEIEWVTCVKYLATLLRFISLQKQLGIKFRGLKLTCAQNQRMLAQADGKGQSNS